MKSTINVLITGAGSPGIFGTIYSMRKNFDGRKVTIVTTDMNPDVIGRYIADKFYQIPSARKLEEYLEALIDICKENKIDIIIPQNTAELIPLSKNKSVFKQIGVKILLSDADSINTSNDKFKLMKSCESLGVQTAKCHLVRSFDELERASKELGWPKEKIVVKPPDLNGSRGVRVIDESIELKDMFYNAKPNSLYIRMKGLYEILGDSFPELIVMEYLPGKEYTVDLLNTGSKYEVIPRTRDLVRSGITFNGSLNKNEQIIDVSNRIANHLKLNYCFGFQFKENSKGVPLIIECNPRVQGTMVMATLAGANLIYAGVKLLLDEEIPDFSIDWHTKFYRYWGGIGINSDGLENLAL